MSLAGSQPGTAIGGVTVPVNLDGLALSLFTNPNQPPFVDFLATLTSVGTGTASVLLAGPALPASLAGIEVTMAAVVSGTTLEATNAVNVTFN